MPQDSKAAFKGEWEALEMQGKAPDSGVDQPPSAIVSRWY